MLEHAMKGDDSAAEGFVAGFSQANVGDTSPNTLGAYCDDGSGQMCSFENSTCANGRSQACHGRGPEFQKLDLGVSSCYEIGLRQYNGAKEVYVSISSHLSSFMLTENEGFAENKVKSSQRIDCKGIPFLP
jgi:neutral ceramidase